MTTASSRSGATSGTGTPTNPYATIQHAYNQSPVQGETIVVAPGTYKLNVVAPYYEPRAFPAVTVNDGPSTVIDVALVPSPIQLQPFAFELQDGGNGIFDPGELSSLAVTISDWVAISV